MRKLEKIKSILWCLLCIAFLIPFFLKEVPLWLAVIQLIISVILLTLIVVRILLNKKQTIFKTTTVEEIIEEEKELANE